VAQTGDALIDVEVSEVEAVGASLSEVAVQDFEAINVGRSLEDENSTGKRNVCVLAAPAVRLYCSLIFQSFHTNKPRHQNIGECVQNTTWTSLQSWGQEKRVVC